VKEYKKSKKLGLLPKNRKEKNEIPDSFPQKIELLKNLLEA
jgi:hypothetical protein